MADATKVDFANGDAVIATDGDWEVSGALLARFMMMW